MEEVARPVTRGKKGTPPQSRTLGTGLKKGKGKGQAKEEPERRSGVRLADFKPRAQGGSGKRGDCILAGSRRRKIRPTIGSFSTPLADGLHG